MLVPPGVGLRAATEFERQSLTRVYHRTVTISCSDYDSTYSNLSLERVVRPVNYRFHRPGNSGGQTAMMASTGQVPFYRRHKQSKQGKT